MGFNIQDFHAFKKRVRGRLQLGYFGSPEYGIQALESSILNSSQRDYPLSSCEEVAQRNLKVDRPRFGPAGPAICGKRLELVMLRLGPGGYDHTVPIINDEVDVSDG